jgi:hypothetical protein
MKKVIVCAVLSSALAAGAASAHHSFAAFDMQKSVTLNGVVKEFQWTNPHSWIVVTADGKTYRIETSSPAQLGRRGWKKSSVKAGDKIAITIHPAKNGELSGAMVKTVINGALVGDPAAAGE